jgi:predicted nucleic acid-binding protein
MIVFALDTNIISYLLKDDQTVLEHYRKELSNGNEYIIPPISYYEIKRGLLLRNALKKADAFDRLCDVLGVGEMDTVAWDEAAKIYALSNQYGRPTEDADIFIAAFCLVNDYTLVTNNAKHFQNIEGLKFVNWK